MKASLKRWCTENSQPKIYMAPPVISRGKTSPLKKLLPGIQRMSIPRKDIGVDWTKDYLVISPNALKYRISARTQELSEVPERRKYKDPRYDPSINWYFILMINMRTLNYVATERIKTIALPLKRRMVPKWRKSNRRERFVKKSALSYEATPRIGELSQPRHKTKKYKPKRPRYVKKSALSAAASPRVLDLAKHRERKDTQTKKNPYRVSKKALAYTSTPRVDGLSKPKSVTRKFVHPPEWIEEWKAMMAKKEEQKNAEREQKAAKKKK